MRFKPGDHIVDWIDDALHGLLSPPEEQYVRAHAADCPICAIALQQGQRRLAALRALPTPEVAPALIGAVLSGVATAAARPVNTGPSSYEWSKRERAVRRWTLRAVAAALVIMAMIHVWFIFQKPSAYDLRVLGQQQMLAGAQGSLRAQLTNNNQPVSGATIRLALYDPKTARTVELASYTTDDAGTGAPTFTLPDWPDGSYTLRATATTGMHVESLDRALTLKRESRVMLSTDKPVYQPGQTIHIRALALRRPDFKPVGAAETLFTLTDPRGNVIFKQPGVTSSFGITSADCPLAAEITQGSYTLLCRVGATESSTTVDIKQYTLPKFKIALSTDKPFYAPGDRVRATLQADYFFNQPVGSAKINFTAQNATNATPVNLAATTDANGHALVEFVLPTWFAGTPQQGGDAIVSLSATVRDSANQEQTRTLAVPVTTAPIHIDLIPESGRLVQGLANRVYVLTTYADGRPAQARLDITGMAPLTTSPLGVTVFELTPQSDQLALTVQASDSAGITSLRRVQLATSAGEGIDATDDYLFRTDKAVYRAGETMTCEILGGGNEPVFVDLIKDGQTMRTAKISLHNGHGTLAIDLSPELSGTLQLNAYRYGETGIALHKTRLAYVQAADDLRIQVAMDHPEYRPGDTAHLSFHLTDAKGKPIAGALSLAGVDEAVYSVLEAAPGLEKTFFTLDQQLLQSVTALYPAGLDFSKADPSQQLLSQAIFSRTANTATGRDELVARLIKAGQISPTVLRRLNTVWGQRAFRQQVEQSDLSPELKAVLLSSGPFSLNANTGPDNLLRAQRIEQQRRGLLPLLWGGVLLASLITLLWVFNRSYLLSVLVVLAIMALLIAILLPSLGRARMTARSTAASADAKAIVTAMQMDEPDLGLPEEKITGSTNPASPRLRQYFPETLLWRPELITDERGNASLDLPLPDSITTWRLSYSAVSAAGQLGATQSAIRVFQPFFVDLNLPSALTRGDEIAIPAVVYNYLQTPQTVALTLAKQEWFEPLDAESRNVTLAAGEVRSIYFRIRVLKAGTFTLQLAARAGDTADAIQRSIEILPGGQRIETTTSGILSGDAITIPLNIPANVIEGSLHAQVKIYPSTFSQLVEGLDSIFQMPSGCFEQTSSSTYPNVLALDYLHTTRTTSPTTEAKARQYIHLGYQRLLSFEITGGGFDWFGSPPADRTLTAYGLMEFQDMARVHDVDPKLIARTRQWLLAQQRPDGSWDPGRRFYHDDPTALGDARLSTTAYIAWSAFAREPGTLDSAAFSAQRYLRSQARAAQLNPYTAALTALALLTIDPQDSTARDLVASLEASRISADGKLIHWSPTVGTSTAFYGAGESADVETTALAALAMFKTPGHTPAAYAALNWLIANKDPRGTWRSTQATVLALKALLTGTRNSGGNNEERRLALQMPNGIVQEIRIAGEQSDVLKAIDISPVLTSGAQTIHLLPRGGPEVAYQIALRYHVPGTAPATPQQALQISLAYDRSSVGMGGTVQVAATLRNTSSDALPMVMADLPIPAGFAVDTSALEKLQTAGQIEKVQVTSRQVLVYLRGLDAASTIELPYALHAMTPVKIQTPSAIAYEYYKPEDRASTDPTRLEITGE